MLPGEVAGRPAAVLGRAVAMATDADRVRLSLYRFQPEASLDSNLMLLENVQVVLLGEPASGTQPEAGQGCRWGEDRQLGRAVAHRAKAELEQVDAPQSLATWRIPCSSRKLASAGTSSQRQTIGLTSSSRTFSCRTGLASGGAT